MLRKVALLRRKCLAAEFELSSVLRVLNHLLGDCLRRLSACGACMAVVGTLGLATTLIDVHISTVIGRRC